MTKEFEIEARISRNDYEVLYIEAATEAQALRTAKKEAAARWGANRIGFLNLIVVAERG